MKIVTLSRALFVLVGLTLVGSGCSRLLPPRKGQTVSFQMALDTRRAPVVQLAGTFIPGVDPAVTKIPVVWAQKVPEGATFTSSSVEVLNKNGEMKVLESVIENNIVYLKFAVPAVDSFTQYNVLVHANYEYRR
jgi:hypothetical protein